jgi:2'-5' RNA ligase
MLTKRLNIAIKPNKELSKYAIEKSRELSSMEKSLYVLDGENYYPHVTLYSPEFPASNIKKVISKVEEIASQTNTFFSKFNTIHHEEGYVVINVKTDVNIMNIHNDLVHSLNPLRDGVLRQKYRDDNYLQAFPDDIKNKIMDYGYPKVFELFNPHLSLIRFADGVSVDAIVKDFVWEYPRFEVSSLGIFEMGENGTCTKLVKEFRLKP